MIALTPVQPLPMDAEEDRRLRALAREFSARDQRFESDRETYGAQFPGRSPGTDVLTLHVDDFSIITNLRGIAGIDHYPSRAFVRTREGDLVGGTFPDIPGYGHYLAGHLGFGRPTYVRAAPAPGALTYAGFEALLADEQAQRQIAARISQSDRDFWIHPYMGLEAAWRLGRRLAERTERTVRVLAPLPTVTAQVNNKLWFREAVAAVLGRESTLESHAGRSAKEISALLRQLSKSSARLALKLADSASGMGTGVFQRDEIQARSTESLQVFVADWLSEHGWDTNAPPISVERWEPDLLGSPSIQLWIPPLGEGMPLLEGVFDQIFYPDQETVFQGSVPTRLPEPLRDRIGKAGLRIGRMFQHLGYLGRCSFDTIVCGVDVTDATIKFTECNGRWGGASTPMTMMNRLFGDYRQQPYIARVLHDRALEGISFERLLAGLDDILFDIRTGEGWAIVFNVGCLQPAGKIDVITLGDTQDAAEHRQEEFRETVMARLWGS